MATEVSKRDRKKKRRVTSDENVSDNFAGKTVTGKRGPISDENLGSGWKSPFKLRSPIFDTKTIYLHDWWLIRVGEGIGVGGFTLRNSRINGHILRSGYREGVKTSYSSGVIKERHDPTTLETSDGFTIFISGLLNTSLSEQNGFSPEVCSYFVVGFPINWDDFLSQHAREGSTRPGVSHTFSPSSFEAMSLFQKRDFLLSCPHEDEDTIDEYLIQQLKSAVASSKDDITRDCETKAQDFHKKVKDKTKDSRTRVRR